MSKKTRPKNISDRATEYATSVIAGETIAGPHVRAACARHVRDLVEGPQRGLVWDLDAAVRAIGYFEDVLCLNGGQFEGKKFVVLPWQAFIIGSLFGWKGSDGYRRFRVAYIETGKGSGKSPLAAGIGLYGLTSDGEARAEVYAAATGIDQAKILFQDAIAMVDMSPALANRLAISGAKGKEWNIAHHKSGSFFRPIASSKGRSGPRPHIALLDEVHEHKNNNVIEMLRSGFKFRLQALMVMITNSGTHKQSVCGEYHDYAAKVSAGQLDDDSFFGFVCALDTHKDPAKADDPLRDEGCWEKVNPSIAYGIPGLKYLREQVTEARGIPSKEALVKRLNFCIWTESANPWIGAEVWFSCQSDERLSFESMRGRTGVAGLDLSSTTDLTAFVIALDPTESDPVTRLLPFFWLPNDGLQKKADKDRVPYLAWKAAGLLEALPGKAIDKLAVIKRISDLCAHFEIRAIAYDRWRIEDFKMQVASEGVNLPDLIPFGQGFKDMGPAVDEFERKLLNCEIAHEGHPIMTWCMANAVTVSDPAGNKKLSKELATGRIDGAIAAAMAIGSERSVVATDSIYNSRDIHIA